MTAHAAFAPSSAERFFACPGSIRLSVGIPRSSSFYADEGTAAHSLAAKCLTEGAEPLSYLGETIDVDNSSFTVNEEMANAVGEFTTLVRHYVKSGYQLHIEVRLDLGHLSPDQWGTGDAILYCKKKRHLVIVDFKYGKGVEVQVENNPQLLAYASGAAKQFGSIKGLLLVVCQPRIMREKTTSWWEVPLERLAEYEDEFREAVMVASRPDAPLNPGEVQCRFCPATGVCPALRDKARAVALVEFGEVFIVDSKGQARLPTPAELTLEQLDVILREASLLDHWIAEVRKYALARAIEHGEIPPSFKLVHKTTHRKWADEDKAARAVTMMYNVTPDDIYTRKLLSPVQMEKLVGKAAAKPLAPYIVHPTGDVTMAPISDKREPVKISARVEFKDILTNETSVKQNHVD